MSDELVLDREARMIGHAPAVYITVLSLATKVIKYGPSVQNGLAGSIHVNHGPCRSDVQLQ